MKKRRYKRIQPPRLHFPKYLKFAVHSNRLIICNSKKVQVVTSSVVTPDNYPPTDIALYGIGKYKFILTEADVLILSFYNDNTKQTECAIVPSDELQARLKPYHYNGDEININLYLTEEGQLMEGYNVGAEGWFMGIWLDEQRNFTKYYNNWSVFEG